MDTGVFIPINNHGWIISVTSPQYMPSFDLNRRAVEKAEAFGFDFALSMIKLHGFGGETEFWDHGLEGADKEALAHLLGKAAEGTAPSSTSMAAAIEDRVDDHDSAAHAQNLKDMERRYADVTTADAAIRAIQARRCTNDRG